MYIAFSFKLQKRKLNLRYCCTCTVEIGNYSRCLYMKKCSRRKNNNRIMSSLWNSTFFGWQRRSDYIFRPTCAHTRRSILVIKWSTRMCCFPQIWAHAGGQAGGTVAGCPPWRGWRVLDLNVPDEDGQARRILFSPGWVHSCPLKAQDKSTGSVSCSFFTMAWGVPLLSLLISGACYGLKLKSSNTIPPSKGTSIDVNIPN